MMRSLPLAFVFSALVLFPGSLFAGDAHPHELAAITVKAKTGEANPNSEIYRGYYSDLSSIADRQDFSKLAAGLRHQIDIVENSGLSPRVLQFFRTMPVVIDDFACVGDMIASASGDSKPMEASACYSRRVPEIMQDKHLSASVWDSEKGWSTNFDPLTRAEVTHTGVVMYRPSTLADRDRERPVLLHELLHAYHDHILSGGFANPAALSWFKQATDKHFYPADQYLMTNEKEFFAVTASVFLFGRDGPIDRAKIKEVQPDYYKYLVWLFGFDPDRSPSTSPVASAY
jgi:hypothetical protein